MQQERRSVHGHRLFVVVVAAALYLLLSVVAERVPEVGTRTILWHFHSASPGVHVVDSRRRHQGGVRPAVCVCV